MQQSTNDQPDMLKPDLKHDNMEYSAATETTDFPANDDIMLDDSEEEITAEELDELDSEGPQDQETALSNAEEDSEEDADNFINVPEEDDELSVEDDEDEQENERVV